jgi:hypothetical protein
VVISGGTLQLATGTGLAAITSLSITNGGVLDITNNSVVINYSGADPIASIQTLVNNAYSGGSWTGTTSITSSSVAAQNASSAAVGTYGVAVVDGADGYVQGLSAGQLEIAPALLGDCNLDGTVNFSDFLILAGNFGKTGAGWDDGDFNYDGTVDTTDVSLLAGNFGDVSALTPPQLADMESFAGQFGDELVANPDGVGFQVVALPEPTSLGLLTLSGVGILARRRRRN